MSQFFASGGQSIGVSAPASVLPMNIQDRFPLGWTGWISLLSKGLSRVFSNPTVQKHQFWCFRDEAQRGVEPWLVFLSYGQNPCKESDSRAGSHPTVPGSNQMGSLGAPSHHPCSDWLGSLWGAIPLTPWGWAAGLLQGHLAFSCPHLHPRPKVKDTQEWEMESGLGLLLRT